MATAADETRREIRRSVRALRVCAAIALSAAIVGRAAAWMHAQGQAGARGIQANEHPVLPIGSPLPEFALPGIDGKVHKSSEFAGSKTLAIVFESNHCPVSQLYEGRIEKLYDE